jgi:hypothetical protein
MGGTLRDGEIGGGLGSLTFSVLSCRSHGIDMICATIACQVELWFCMVCSGGGRVVETTLLRRDGMLN